MIPFDKLKNASITRTDTPILSGKVVGRSITVETSHPWLIGDIKNFLHYQLAFRYFCTTNNCKPNIKSYKRFCEYQKKNRPERVQWYRNNKGIKGANSWDYIYTFTNEDRITPQIKVIVH